MTGTFAPDLTLHTGRGTTSVAELMRPARPVLLDLGGRTDLRESARDWRRRVDIRSAQADHRPADALLIRPDAYIAWAAADRRTRRHRVARAAQSALRLVRHTPGGANSLGDLMGLVDYG